MKRFFGDMYKFIKAFNFCFAVMLIVFVSSLFLSIYLDNLWYLVVAALDFAFYFAFYLSFSLLLDYYTYVEEQQRQAEEIEDIKQMLERVITQDSKEQVIDFNTVNINNKK